MTTHAMQHYHYSHRSIVLQELKEAGVSSLGLWRLESQFLPKILKEDEHISGVAYGYQGANFVMLVATGKRVLFFDKKPLSTHKDDIEYPEIQSASFRAAELGGTVTLRSRAKTYHIRTFNRLSAERFVQYVVRRGQEYNKRREY